MTNTIAYRENMDEDDNEKHFIYYVVLEVGVSDKQSSLLDHNISV
jgi:hypothetical protein